MKVKALAIAQWPSLTDAEAAQVLGGASGSCGSWKPFWQKVLGVAIGAVLETALTEWRKYAQDKQRGTCQER